MVPNWGTTYLLLVTHSIHKVKYVILHEIESFTNAILHYHWNNCKTTNNQSSCLIQIIYEHNLNFRIFCLLRQREMICHTYACRYFPIHVVPQLGPVSVLDWVTGFRTETGPKHNIHNRFKLLCLPAIVYWWNKDGGIKNRISISVSH